LWPKEDVNGIWGLVYGIWGPTVGPVVDEDMIEFAMEKENKVKIWRESAKRNSSDARDFLKSKHFDWCLFVWGLALEKIIKSQIVEIDEEVPLIHNLVTLCKIAKIKLSEDDKMKLSEINTYNIEARYEEIKSALYRKATKDYTQKWSEICSEFYNKFGGI
jgi:HEPN domain-containing protein